MIFTSARILRFAPRCPEDRAVLIAGTLEAKAPDYGVTTPLRRAHFMAQMAHESGGFSRLDENLNYSARRIPQVWSRLSARAEALAHNPQALANAAYANKNGNGNEGSGDGWRFKGRGIIQLTGRANYESAPIPNLVDNPDLAAEPGNAVIIALSFWKSHACNEAADADNVELVTRLINGGTHGLAERRALTAKAKAIFI